MRTCICSPCGILGYGFPQESFRRALAEKPDAIVVDAGSTDAGPHKLGAGVAIVSRMAAKKDLRLLMQGARELDIPLVIGSAGVSGSYSGITPQNVYPLMRSPANQSKISTFSSTSTRKQL